jgi:hypothetical protein
MIKDVDGGGPVNTQTCTVSSTQLLRDLVASTLIQKLQKKMGQVALDFSGEAQDGVDGIMGR